MMEDVTFLIIHDSLHSNTYCTFYGFLLQVWIPHTDCIFNVWMD